MRAPDASVGTALGLDPVLIPDGDDLHVPRARPMRPRWERPALGAAFVVALALRLWQVDRQVMLDDEWHAIAMLSTAGYARIASTFGIVDHSIPLTLFYKAVADLGWLSEAAMLSLPLLCGMLTFVALVVAGGRVMRPGERVTFAWLLAVSPLLVLYARQARPYALTLLLTLAALAAAIAWWRRRRAWHGALYVAAAVPAVYAHLIVAPAVFGVWIALAVEAVRERRRLPDLARALLPGVVAGVVVALLLAPPLTADWGALEAKAGADRVTAHSAFRAAGMLLGTGSGVMALGLLALAVVGVRESLARARFATRVVLTVLVLQTLAVVASGALWLSWPMVLARYLLLIVPFAAWAVALGVGRLGAHVGAAREPVAAVAGVFLAAAVLLTGPLPPLLVTPNAFFAHHAFWADFDPARNRVLREISEGPIPAFYREMAARPAGEVTLIEAPWRFESMFNRQPLFQRVHRQHVRIGLVGGVCAPGAFAEQPRRFPSRFRNLVDLAAPDGVVRSRGDYLVVHRRLELSNMSEPWQTWDGRGLPPVDGCLPTFAARFGPPVHEDETITVYALRR
jgi:hypothetical protein